MNAQEISRPLKTLVKRALFRPRGITYGQDSYIHSPSVIKGPSRIRLGRRTVLLRDSYLNAVEFYAGIPHQPEILFGDDVYVGRYVYLTAINRISIGSGSVLSEHVYITDLMHGLDPEAGPIIKQPLTSKGPVSIGEKCFLGYRTAIMPGVSLGDHCIVGANSVVTRSFPAFSMIAGSPARLLKVYSPAQKEWVRPESHIGSPEPSLP